MRKNKGEIERPDFWKGISNLFQFLLPVWALGISARFIVSFLSNQDLLVDYQTSMQNVLIDWLPLFIFALGLFVSNMLRLGERSK